jgi:ribosomal protein S18 acetylase RimI-like enzyme
MEQHHAVEFRDATRADAEAIADLHADSWRRHYRGVYLDSYLDGDVFAERRVVWTGRFADPDPDARTILCEHEGALVGFAHIIVDDDPTWGALLDNLHVAYAHKRGGIGTQLMAASARAVLERPQPTGMYLWVLERNAAGQAFYRARGGSEVGREVSPLEGGGTAVGLRYAWPDPSVLLAQS